MAVINLSRTIATLRDVEELINDLQGVELDEERAVEDQSKKRSRAESAAISKALNRLADRLDLAAALVRVEYWNARGYPDPSSR